MVFSGIEYNKIQHVNLARPGKTDRNNSHGEQ